MTFAMIGPVLGGRGCYFRLMQTVHPVHDCGHYIPQDWILDFFSTLSFGQCGGTTRNGGTLCILNFFSDLFTSHRKSVYFRRPISYHKK